MEDGRNRPDLLYQDMVRGPARHSLKPVSESRPINGRLTNTQRHDRELQRRDRARRAAGGASPVKVPVVVIGRPVEIRGLLPTLPVAVPIYTNAFALAAGQQLELSPAKPTRAYLLVQNNTGTVLFLAFGRKANDGDIQIQNGGNYEPSQAPSTSVNVYTTAGGRCAINEG